MQAISAELTASLAKKNPVYKKTVEINRRLWSAGAFVYDTALDITDQVKKYSPISWKFDSEAFNSWTLDNTSLVFRNDRNQWKQGNAKGYFSGLYQISESKITIKFGAQLADGTFEVLKSFTGYIANDPIADPSGKVITVTIQGGMSKFGKESAEAINNPITDEAHAYSAPDIVDYATVNNGVAASGLIVKRGTTAGGAVAATEIKPTTGYTIAGQNSKTLPLTVTLVTALTATESIWITYKYWYQAKTLEWLAKQVLTLNGITDHSGVEAAKFSSSIENLWDFNSQADWNTCTKQNIDTVTIPGSFKIGLIDDFGDGDYSANPVWTELYGSGFWSINSGRLKISAHVPVNTIKTAMDKVVGSWQFRLYQWDYFFVNDYCKVWFIATGENATYKYPTAGYYLYMAVGGTAIMRADGTVLIGGLANPTNTDIIRISRDSAGFIYIYYNEVLKGISPADTTYSTSDRFAISSFTTNNSYPLTFFFDDFFFWEDGSTVGTGILTSPIKDAGVDVTSWGKIASTYTPNGATVLIETYTSGTSDFSADNDPAGWASIDGVGQIQSDADKIAAGLPMRQYIQYRVTATLASLVNPVTPVFDQITLAYYTSTTLIDLVDLTGMTCKQVLDIITEMPAYEQGFKADETFVYRPRVTTAAPVIEFRSDTNILEVRNVSDGADRVFNSVTAEFGIYKVVADASADAHPNSMDIFKTRNYPVSSSSLLPAANVNIAWAIAPTILLYSKTPRRRCVVESMFLPQLELGDKGTLYFDDPTAMIRWLWGDTIAAWGDPGLEYYNATILANRYNFYGVVVRIEGVELDPDTFMTTFNLTEVL